MIATILSFAVSLILLAGLLGYKILRMRRNEVMPEEIYDIRSFIPEHINLEKIKKAMIEYGKKYGHETITTVIRAWFRIIFFLQRSKETILPRIKALIPKKHREIKRPAVVSDFLQKVAQYKNKLKKISNEIKEEERKNF